MEFGGFLGLDGLVGSSSDHHSHSLGGGGGGSCTLFSMDNSSSTLTSELPMKQQRSLFGGFLKHDRSAAASASASETAAGQEQQVDWRSLKLARTASSTTTTEQMLSFSAPSSKPEQYASLYHLNSDGYHNHYYPYSSSSSYSSSSVSAAHSSFRSAGLGSVSTNMSIHGARGPFTPSQWMELEHQALIYKYIDANIPIPSSLLVPIRRSTNPSPLSPFLSGSFRSTTLGWGPFHLGFSGNADPEPGRCRRTDGKKWRCSRDAVADQKYCERHMNRGRHRSRKHVEGHSGQASKAVPIIAPSQPAGAAVSGGGGCGLSNNTLAIMSQQNKSLQPGEPSPPRTDRIQMSKENTKYHVRDSNGLSLLDDASTKPLDSLFPIPKHQNPFEGTLSRPDFGLIPTDSLLNPMRATYSDDAVGGFDSASKLHDRQPQHRHHPLRHFIDDWPKSQSELPSIAWPKIDEMKSDRTTQLSISIPSDISSSSSSPNQEKLALSPLRLSREFNPMSGGGGGGNQRQAAGWIPISWEPTIGGPLGEVLNKTNSSTTPKDFSSSSSLNLLPDGWDTSPPRMQSSPTGVLQKTSAFGSLSSSTGSSPRAENNNKAAGDSNTVQCDNLLLGSTGTKILN